MINVRNYRVVYAHLYPFYGKSTPVRVSFLLQILARVLNLILIPLAISHIITSLSAKDYGLAFQFTGLFILCTILFGITIPLIKFVGHKGEQQAYKQMTAKYIRGLVRSDLDYFNSNLSGYLTAATRLYLDGALTLARALRDKYMGTIFSILMPLAVIGFMNSTLGLIALVVSIVQAAYVFWSSKALDPYRKQSRELYKRNSGRIADIISNILAVKASAQEERYLRQVDNGAKEEGRAYYLRYMVQTKLVAVRELITALFFAVLLLVTIMLVQNGSLAIGGAVLVVTYMTTIIGGIYNLADCLDEHDDLIDKIVPAVNMLMRDNKVVDPRSPVPLRRVRGEIQFNHVRFSYDSAGKSHTVLDDFNLTIPAGQKVGIVGSSGAGKSTLVRLLLRFNDVTEGSISLDDIDIRNVTQHDLRRHISYVPQEPLLLHSSIKDNVLLDKPKASDAEVEAALKAAHAWQFVSKLDDGIQSIVGERGVKLSGGQKQRIAISRAVLKDAPLIILDEATSALDSESEQIIKDSFKTILEGKTAIVIAHRLSTLSSMDRIIVLSDGKIAEDGTHEELLALDGLYARLWYRQQRKEHIQEA